VTILAPELVLDESGVRRGVAVVVLDGVIDEVLDEVPEHAERLDGTGLMPGFSNAHSHAFQRNLRGVSERPGDFWSWREQMCELAANLEPESIYDVSRSCFAQMRRAGYTTVNEFHYVHHRPDGTRYDEPNELAQAVCEAAEAERIRITLLLVAYERGGEARFRDPDLDSFLARVQSLRGWAARRPLVSVGVAPHSIRAVSSAWLERLSTVAPELPLHVHANEQRGEIERCIAEYGVRPIELLAETGILSPRTTVVHATHADSHEVELLASTGTTVCLCPTTEGNLGDGLPPTAELAAAHVPLVIGSDSNARLDPLEELRELETVARRVAERRHVLDLRTLLWAGWGGGKKIMTGSPADLVAIDLGHEALSDVEDEDLAAALVFAGDTTAVVRTWVAGS
jgi:formimidoylglutamate deiminase